LDLLAYIAYTILGNPPKISACIGGDMRHNNLAEMFFSTAERLGERTAYMHKPDNEYLSISFNEANESVLKIAAGLSSLGVNSGDKVALISPNRYEWAFSDFAIISLGAINVPIYPSLMPEQVQYILADSEAKVVICSDEDQYKKVVQVKDQCPNLKSVVVMDMIKDDGNHISLEKLMKDGADLLKDNPDLIKEKVKKIKADDIATIIYTSGTTGEPKGALLTHGNFISNVEGSLHHLSVNESDLFLSFLPLSHVFERMAGHYLVNYIGASIAYAVSIDTVAENMGEVHPTVMTSVPRLYEKMYAKILENVEIGSPIKRKIFYWALGVGREYVNKIMFKQNISGSLQFKRNLAYKLVFSKLAERVGGKMRFFVSGGAPLAKEIAEFFGAAGLTIYEGYGLTETSPVIAVNKEDLFKFGTVGPVIPNVEVKIADDGEILTRGPHIMAGYFKKEAETKEAIDEEGWFHTGDIGFIDDDGCLTITDRKKNILVTSGGKNIAPQPIENKLVTCKYIEQALVIGDKRKFCTAVIVPAFENLDKWAQDNNMEYKDFGELSRLFEVRELIKKDVDGVNNDLASYETIKEFYLTEAPFSIETGELTPSLKVKRKVVLNKFAEQIEEMYKV
jgi:long-chain acyl-CoA synthetase